VYRTNGISHYTEFEVDTLLFYALLEGRNYFKSKGTTISAHLNFIKNYVVEDQYDYYKDYVLARTVFAIFILLFVLGVFYEAGNIDMDIYKKLKYTLY
jgi:hypothetical protein